MTDTPPPTPTTPTTPKPKPASLRAGTPKQIAQAAFDRKERYHTEGFALYLKSLADEQSSIYQKKRPRQETLDQQMDILDAMFTYLAIHADWKDQSPLSYAAALRAQKQFCTTLKDIRHLKFAKPTAATPSPTFPIGGK